MISKGFTKFVSKHLINLQLLKSNTCEKTSCHSLVNYFLMHSWKEKGNKQIPHTNVLIKNQVEGLIPVFYI